MENQIWTTIVTAISTIIAAFGGMIVTLMIQNNRNKIELKFKKLDFLYIKKNKLEEAKKGLKDIAIEKNSVNENDFKVIAANFVLEQLFNSYRIFETISHYISNNKYQIISKDFSDFVTVFGELKILALEKKEVNFEMVEESIKRSGKLSKEIEFLINEELSITINEIEKTFK